MTNFLIEVDSGGSSLLDSGGDGGGGISVPPAPVAPAPASSSAPAPSGFDYDLSPASIAAARAKGNVEGDVRSAYQTFLTGVPSGRGGEYAVDAQRRFGYSSITEAAAAYLDAAGLRRLLIEDTSTEPEPVFGDLGDGDFFGLPPPPIDPEPGPDTKGVVTNEGPEGPGDPFATLGDLLERIFAVREPETTAPVVVVGDATAGGGGGGGGASGEVIVGYDAAGQPVYSGGGGGKKRGGLGLILVLLAIGGGAFYWFYWRKRNAD
jgi:hypothetical protein